MILPKDRLQIQLASDQDAGTDIVTQQASRLG